MLGDAIGGVVEAPHSAKESVNLIACDHASADDWRFHSPFTASTADEREHLLFPDVVSPLPQIRGRPYAKNSRFRASPIMRIQLPTLPTGLMRAI